MINAITLDNLSGYVGALELSGVKDTAEGWREYIHEDILQYPGGTITEEEIEAVIRCLEEDGYVI